jgi:hypothetical protein
MSITKKNLEKRQKIYATVPETVPEKRRFPEIFRILVQ